ncbi:MAG: hypothetical protein CMJ64_15210 [Planctomycetaceae bacterium]|nr:hypothetical protein [Planctomycetaceae bacterium]
MHTSDPNATILHRLGIDHKRFTIKYQGLDWRLTSVTGADVVPRAAGLFLQGLYQNDFQYCRSVAYTSIGSSGRNSAGRMSKRFISRT